MGRRFSDIQPGDKDPNSARMALVTPTLARLRHWIAANGNAPLPTLRELATGFDVSLATVLLAARHLRDEGLLEFSRGRRLRLVRNAVELPQGSNRSQTQMEPQEQGGERPDRGDAVERCASRIAARIRSGEVQAGMPIPKAEVLARELHVSRSTVAGALSRLSHSGLVHQIGRRWWAGPRIQAVTYRAGGIGGVEGRPFIVLVQDHPRSWEGMAYHARTARFCLQFSTESERFGVPILSAFTMPDRAPRASPCRNLDETQRYIRQAGAACLGTLIVATDRSTPELLQWHRGLVGEARKVVWYDRNDLGRPTGLDRRTFCRCHFSERKAVEVALEHLRTLGHRRLLFAARTKDTGDWVSHRFDLLRTEAEAQGLHLEAPAPSSLPESSDKALATVLRQELRRSGATALIAPRDLVAYHLYHALAEAGLRVPQDVSLVSFDNYAMLQALPISAVDFGMGHLGYSAFHWLFGALGIRRGSDGDIQAVPHLVDRGSTGKPAALE